MCHVIRLVCGLAAAWCVCVVPALAAPPATDTGEAQWIWHPEEDQSKPPAARRYFRRAFMTQDVQSALVEISCDDEYVLFVNGQEVGRGKDWKKMGVFDIKKFLVNGRNVIAVLATNQDDESSAGLVARVNVKRVGGTGESFATDANWKTSNEEHNGWRNRGFNDAEWTNAVALGEFGQTAPWHDLAMRPGDKGSGRFTIAKGFRIERVASPKATGSLIAMTFNERGEIIAAREKGGLIVLRDADGDGGAFEEVRDYANQLKGCQGLLALNGQVFAVGNGPQGLSFCRLTDDDGDGQADKLETLFKFKAAIQEHGPHAITLGPDGLIYIVVGNHASAELPIANTSPYHHYYEGDLLLPKFEDAHGHAVGLKAPGGHVLRTDIDGSFCELFAGGLRNSYDIAFNRDGELFTFDSDMEWDEGLPWYRPTRINHVTPGAEFGWRSGWSKFAEHYPDNLPATFNVGRGSPTGLEFYNHLRYPAKYHDCLFACDWSQGQILAVTMKRENGTYAASAEVFLEGRPLNVCDLVVGPDGWLYFCTGGRGTEGGVYRIVYEGEIPPPPANEGIMRAIRMPQLYSAWGRDRIARIKDKMGDEWVPELARVADDAQGDPQDRVRAIDLMQLVGPFPSKRFLVKLGQDQEPLVRAKAAYLMGIHFDESTNAQLVKLLADPDASVRRVACDSLARCAHLTPPNELLRLLAENNPYVVWAARRALERLPRSQWQPAVLTVRDPSVFIHGAIALALLDPDATTLKSILDRTYQFTQSSRVSDEQFLGLLRVTELALTRGHFKKSDLPKLSKQLADEYPTSDWKLNRELIRLWVYLQEPAAMDRAMQELVRSKPYKDEDMAAEQVFLSLNLRYMKEGWIPEYRYKLLLFYEAARTLGRPQDGAETEGSGHSFAGYIDNAARDFLEGFSPEEREAVLQNGVKMPGAALQVLRGLDELPKEQVGELIKLDEELESVEGAAAQELRAGLIAMLGTSGDLTALKHLHQVFESDPERRGDVAFAVAAFALETRRRADDYRLLLRSLSVVNENAAPLVLEALAKFREKSTKPEIQRQVIMLGLKLKEDGADLAIKLLEYWNGEQLTGPNDSWEKGLAAWQKWFAEQNPDLPPAVLPTEPAGSKYAFDQVWAHLQSPAGKGDPAKGALVFAEKGQCIKCHRFGPKGEAVGPDLSTVAQRFQRREVLESLFYPSLVISDQYLSKTVTTKEGKVYTGILGPLGTDSIVILTADAKKIELKKDQIEDAVTSPKSAMPEGLLDALTPEEISDLFAYLLNPPQAK